LTKLKQYCVVPGGIGGVGGVGVGAIAAKQVVQSEILVVVAISKLETLVVLTHYSSILIDMQWCQATQ